MTYNTIMQNTIKTIVESILRAYEWTINGKQIRTMSEMDGL